MTPQKITPLVLLMFTLVCALPATVVSPPSAIAQEDDDMSLDEAENLASDTVSNVLDNDNTAGDNINTEVSVPITDIDQTDANLGLSEALDVTVEQTLSPQEEPSEFEAFCFVITGPGSDPLTGCFDTSEECVAAQESIRSEAEEEGEEDPIIEECEGVEELPPDALDCDFIEQGELTVVDCNDQQDT